MKYVIGILLGLSGAANAHEMVPAYPTMKPSYITGVSVTNMKIFNRRDDVRYYEIGVFTSEWEPIPFASEEKIIKLEYLGKKTFEVYIRNSDLDDATYICTLSKLEKDNVRTTGVSSKICSKIK